MRIFKTICVAALFVALCMPAFAETQNVKVSGDINTWVLSRRGFSLDKDDNTANSWDTTNVFMSQVGVNVEADLTDNVSTFIRVINERDWDAPTTDTMSIGLDEAYITLKEMLYAPLTVKIGRQNLWFGKGFIVGNNVSSWDLNNHLTANEISDMTAFDAIRGTLDYDPWTIDLVMAKIDENLVASTDDVDLYGVNVGYVFDKYNGEAEAYYWQQHDRSDRNDTLGGKNETHVVGIRGSFMPYENMNVWGEFAGQFGDYNNTTTNEYTDREAYAANVGVDYQWMETVWTPKLGAEYIYYSGAQAEAHTSNSSDWQGWNMMYRGKFDSMIREYQNLLYNTAFDNATSRTRNNGSTNQHQVVIRGAVNPMEDVIVDANVNMFWLDENLDFTKNGNLPAAADADTYIGTELDGKVTYNYTEDVTFQVMGGIFWAGDMYPGGQDDTAVQAAARCAVEF